MSKAIQHGVMIAEYQFTHAGGLQFDRKFGDHGGGGFQVVEKFGGCLFTVCLFFVVVLRLRKFRYPTKKKGGESLCAGPPNVMCIVYVDNLIFLESRCGQD